MIIFDVFAVISLLTVLCFIFSILYGFLKFGVKDALNCFSFEEKLSGIGIISLGLILGLGLLWVNGRI